MDREQRLRALEHIIMLIKVTQEHIDKGIKGIPSKCPIALAIKDIYPNLDFIDIGSSGCWTRIGDYKYITPSECKIFMNKFDNDKKVEPFEFELTTLCS